MKVNVALRGGVDVQVRLKAEVGVNSRTVSPASKMKLETTPGLKKEMILCISLKTGFG